ncbi:UxaA family hydrolase [Antarcticimicrobium sediminis]|uniref:Altronate dehydratase n=1 Tax=Antarcticimicrobium sediminis TaxID=2546227 RepID=A0A4R5EZJ0_9RHOB|nr:altronate dehydratase family protein [Antarcticimicrobium sediminis]TDE40290.1 altronate dehydratase [Antarcticimicrobium sediminis]
MSDKIALQLHDTDNVLIVLSNIEHGKQLTPFDLLSNGLIPRGHKAALTAMKPGDTVRKYGQIIGIATQDIAPGEHVHTQNVKMAQFDRDHAYGQHATPTEMVPEAQRATFQGYRRPDGTVGTRNYVGIITSVNCSASAARLLAREAAKRGLLAKYPNVDGIVPIVHGAGCCIGTDDEAFYKLQRTIWGFATHANFASVLMLGLGCEANQIPLMLEVYGNPPPEKFRYHTLQAEGGTRKTVELGLQWLEQALEYANTARRETVPASELTVALQCGGSDGYSGITSNPALGHAVDLLVRNGGTAALAETPEIYGAEHLLTNRAASPEVGQKLVGLLEWWEVYAAKHGSEMNNNPTPGNKAGGLTTILEKSLGAVAKAGSTNLNGVYKYSEKITAKGLVFVDSPGYDPVSITGEVASGCNMVCFTTGRGSCYGNKPAPSIKIASNTPMYQRMQEDMDLNCGTIADGTETVAEAGARIFQEMLEVASGKRTVSEALDVGDAEFAPWQTYAQM